LQSIVEGSPEAPNSLVETQFTSHASESSGFGCANRARFSQAAKKQARKKNEKEVWTLEYSLGATRLPQGINFMWNSRKYAAMAVAGAGLAAVAATPASACFAWGHSGVYSYGWAYANTGFSDYRAYSYRSCGGNYQIQGWGECDGYSPCGWAPFPPLVVTVPVTDSAAPDERVPRRQSRACRSKACSER
jgi:hypothetical protein